MVIFAVLYLQPQCHPYRVCINCAVFLHKLQISPVIVNVLKNGFPPWIQCIFLVVVKAKKFFSEKIFFCFQNLDALYRPVEGKPLVLEDWAWALLWHLP